MSRRSYMNCLEDQLTLLLLLNKLKSFGFQTKRLKLQKLIYLADIFGTIIGKKPTSYTFRVYKHGPFSSDIYADVERLVSLGFAQARELETWTPEQERSFNYVIKKSGLERIAKILEIPEFSLKEKAMETALLAAGHLSSTKIQELVYGEPNYIKAKEEGFGTEINPRYEFAVKFKEMAETIGTREYRLELTVDEISWLYLNFMRDMKSETRAR